MIIKNKNVLFALYPATFLPLFAAGAFYAKLNLTDPFYILYAVVPFAVSLAVSTAAFAAKKSLRVNKFMESLNLAKFAVLCFATFALSLAAACVGTLAILGKSAIPVAMGAWMILITIFSVYLFCWLYVVYRIFYKDNPDYL